MIALFLIASICTLAFFAAYLALPQNETMTFSELGFFASLAVAIVAGLAL